MNLEIARAAFYDELQKIADVQTALLPYRQRVIEQFRGLLPRGADSMKEEAKG